MRALYRPNPKAKTKRTYPDDWKEKGAGLTARDGDRCANPSCGITRIEANKRGLRLVKAHIFSVRTGNNRKTNLRWLCDRCHEKDPKHHHLWVQRLAKEAKIRGK